MGLSSGNADHSPKKCHSSSSDSSSDNDRDRGTDHNQPLATNITINIHPNQPAYPMPPPPHTMAYPPAPPGYGYGHGQQNYNNPHPHPYAGYPNGYANRHAYNYYPQPQGAAGGTYYGSAATMQQYNPAPSNFFRRFIMCSIFLLMGLFLCSIIANMILRPKAPVYKLESFSVSNFNAGNSSVTADWASKITIENPNKRLNAYFSNLKVTVYHKQVELAHSFWLHGFELQTQQNTHMDVNLSLNSQNSSLQIPRHVVEEITKERASGTITIGVGLSMLTTFRYRSVLSRSRPIYAFCADIKLSFQGNSTSATAYTNRNCPLEMELFQ
ncbi:hypothetical protein L6164_009558 [Bauhinia variegata]|uniref:Uncharacterized protein n=1 Tax=Bauhinia variegata TaxID=167791 RepID=A0ACB9PK43_BAUVA|nr:hypothetical protein L6164_009558 [Bauhinia variegata]